MIEHKTFSHSYHKPYCENLPILSLHSPKYLLLHQRVFQYHKFLSPFHKFVEISYKKLMYKPKQLILLKKSLMLLIFPYRFLILCFYSFQFHQLFKENNILKLFVTSVFANYFKFLNVLGFAISDNLTFDCVSPNTKQFFVGGGNFHKLPLIFSDSLKKKEEIEVLNCRVAYALNSTPQSRFSDDSGKELCQLSQPDIILSPVSHRNSSSKWIPTPPTINRIQPIMGIAVIPKMVCNKELPVHPKKPRSIIRDGTPLAITIPKRLAPIWASLLLGLVFGFYVYRNRRYVQNTSLSVISNKSENYKIERWHTLNKGIEVPSISSSPHDDYTLILMKKQSHSLPIRFQRAPENKVGTDLSAVFSIIFICSQGRIHFSFIMMTVFFILSKQKYEKKKILVFKWEITSSSELYLSVTYSEVISLPFIQFLEVITYPLFFTTEPVNSIPSFHPSCSISLGGITTVYLYIGLPLYSRALCFCNFILFCNVNCYKNVAPQSLYTPVALLLLAKHMKVEKISIKEMINARKARGMILLEEGFEPKEVNPHSWIVPSQSGCGTYQVSVFMNHWKCSCPDFLKRGVECMHICAVKIWKNLSEKFEQLNLHIKQNIGIKEKIPIASCKFCNSLDIIKYGTKSGKQVYKCKDCNRKFVDNIDFENMKYNPKIIALTLDLYFRGFSLRKVSHHLKQFYNLNISYMTVHRWIEKYIGVMNEYVGTLKPDIGDVWHTDEMMVNVGGTWEYLWNCMDERTRFQLASVVSKERKVRDARMVFKKAKKNSGGRKPKYIVTDGLGSYKRAVNKEFKTNIHETEHLYNVGLQHHPNNNHVERLHGTIREREKTMRAVKTDETPIVEGHRLYYNFIKPHEALDGKTPSEMAGITIDGDNKWLSLMKTALWYKKMQNMSKNYI